MHPGLNSLYEYISVLRGAKAVSDAMMNEPDEGPEEIIGVSICPLMNGVESKIIEQAAAAAGIPVTLGKAWKNNDSYLLHVTHGKAGLRVKTTFAVIELLDAGRVNADLYCGTNDFNEWRPLDGIERSQIPGA